MFYSRIYYKIKGIEEENGYYKIKTEGGNYRIKKDCIGGSLDELLKKPKNFSLGITSDISGKKKYGIVKTPKTTLY